MAERVVSSTFDYPGEYAGRGAEGSGVRAAPRRVSWGAVLAGVILVLIIQVLLSLLGVGIGASTIDPTGETPMASSLGIGAGIWWVLSTLIAIFAGGWVAGRLAGMPNRTDGILHGLVTWGLAMLLMIYLLTTTVSSLIGGAFSVVGSAMQTAGQMASQGAQTVANGSQSGPAQGVVGDLQRQVGDWMKQARTQVEGTTQQVQQVARDDDTRALIQKVVTSGPDSLNQQDRERAITVISDNTGVSRPDAERKLAEWQQTYQDAQQRARQAAEATADAVSQASLWSALALLLGAIVAAVGGMLGAPRTTDPHRA